jgi:hypothetical protein
VQHRLNQFFNTIKKAKNQINKSKLHMPPMSIVILKRFAAVAIAFCVSIIRLINESNSFFELSTGSDLAATAGC